MEERKQISKKMRFDVLKRDSFTCQYCGKQAPNVVLEIDHIKPVYEGGKNTMLNLITSCFECNRGKGKRKLDVNSSLNKELKELNVMQERNEQIKLMNKWRKQLEKESEDILKIVIEFIYTNTNLRITITGIQLKNTILKDVENYGINEYLKLLRETLSVYYKGNMKEVQKSLEKITTFKKINDENKEKPYLKDIHYCTGILRNRLSRFEKSTAFNNLLCLHEDYGYSIREIKDICFNVYSWNQFLIQCDDIMGV